MVIIAALATAVMSHSSALPFKGPSRASLSTGTSFLGIGLPNAVFHCLAICQSIKTRYTLQRMMAPQSWQGPTLEEWLQGAGVYQEERIPPPAAWTYCHWARRCGRRGFRQCGWLGSAVLVGLAFGLGSAPTLVQSVSCRLQPSWLIVVGSVGH